MRPAKTLIAAAIAIVALAGTATGVAAATSTAVPPIHHVPANPLTGYPTQINTVNLDGYQIETSYPLGINDAGNTYLQTYSGDSVTAVAIDGPLAGTPPVTFKYIALPITHKILMLVWLIPSGQHNSFVYNFNDHESSVVTYDLAGNPSLGSVFIVKAGPNPIP